MAAIRGIQPWSYVSAGGTNLQQVSANPSMLCLGTMGNISSNPRWMKMFDTTSAPNLGVSVATLNFIIPGNTSGAGSNIPIPPTQPWSALQFVNGIYIAITGNIGLQDATGIGANEVNVSLGYIDVTQA